MEESGEEPSFSSLVAMGSQVPSLEGGVVELVLVYLAGERAEQAARAKSALPTR